MIVRALHGAAKIHSGRAPHDTVHFRLHYPAEYTGSDAERLTGILPAVTTDAPWPVAIVLPGINVGADQYRWLAIALAQAGIATVTFDFVDELMPGNVALSPGLDITAVAPDSYGTRPSATAIAPILGALHRLERDGPTAGAIDPTRFMVIGHSAGGTVALENANRAWFPGLRSVATYGAHTMPALLLGHPAGTVLPVPDDVPVLLVSGAEDGVIRQSVDRYKGGPDHHPVRATFERAVRPHRASRYVEVHGGTHMVFGHPGDDTTARGFLDAASTPESLARDGEVRCFLAGLFTEFARATLAPDPTRSDLGPLDAHASNPRVAEWTAK